MHFFTTLFAAMADALDKMLGGDEPDVSLYDVEEAVKEQEDTTTPPATPQHSLDAKESKAAKSLELMSPGGAGNRSNGDHSSVEPPPPKKVKKSPKATTWATYMKEKLPAATIARFKARVPVPHPSGKKQKQGLQNLDVSTHDTVRQLVLTYTRVLLKEAVVEMGDGKVIKVEHIDASAAPGKHDCYAYDES